jgi:hypothetical protein
VVGRERKVACRLLAHRLVAARRSSPPPRSDRQRPRRTVVPRPS